MSALFLGNERKISPTSCNLRILFSSSEEEEDLGLFNTTDIVLSTAE